MLRSGFVAPAVLTRHLALFLSILLLLGACDGGSADGEVSDIAIESVADSDDTTTTTSPFSTTTTVVTIPPSYVPLLDEPPPFEEVAITTEDGVDLYARYWVGGSVAVLAGHDFHTRTDANDGDQPQSSESLLWWTGPLANAGYTVLSPDYRGHGHSPEDPSVRNSPVDLKAAYQFLADAGYEKIVMAGFVGSGTAAVVLDATDEEVNFDGIAMIWSAPQEVGLDAQHVLYGIDAPVYVVGFDVPVLERWAKLMSLEVDDLYDLFIYPQAPNGTQFVDAFGEEFVGRLLDFVSYVASS